ncbi:trypsin-like peptidase domain-containing protein [Tundrisphaera lichenicola]|uniref:S1C family serine protease n=1 Tax=Tundrisphaera lichenicola TaxID=2029860 RepID=UPI003EB92160
MRMTLALAGLSLILASSTAIAQEGQDEAVREAVVKIYATMRGPDVVRPWLKAGQQEATGTGVVIEGNRILTNAHVVNYASQLFVEPNQSGDKLEATIEFVAPGIDLAVLKLEDESFFEKHRPIPRAEKLPEIKETVIVYGFPTGGSSLSITKGIVSRIEFVPYGANTQGLRIQIDAAVNPGNSGGPALVGDRMIGLVNSMARGAENIGYIIPAEEVDLFLKDIADGSYDYKPVLRERLQTLENEALKAKLGFTKKSVGIVVHEPDSDDPAYPIKKWDVITKIGDHEIDNVCMTKVRDDLRVRFEYYLQSLTKDGKIPLTIVRDGQEMNIELPVAPRLDELIQPLRSGYPSYFIYGPLTFSTASAEFLAVLDRSGMQALFALFGSPLATRRGDRQAFPGEELVVVSSPMFPHRIAKGYDNPLAKVVDQVNGIKIKNLKHLVETLRDAKDPYITITFVAKNSETMVFDRKEILKATDEILSDNSVRQQSSEDLAPIWSKKE